MNTILLVGDVHAVEKDLADCQSLIDYIDSIVKENHCIPVFLGDLYDSHAIIRAEVQRFWYDAFKKLTETEVVMVLAGNHDKPNNKSSNASALLAHIGEHVEVAFADTPIKGIRGSFFKDTLFMGYYDDHEKMIKLANESDCKYLICHQTFSGAQYENGFFAKDGIDQNLFKQEKIISGHIHKEAILGKVLYPGSPRWRNISDATMEERYLYLVDEDLNCIKKYPTSPVCSRIHRLQDTQESPLSSQVFIEKDRYHIDIKGDREFTLNRKSLYPNCKVSVCETKVQPTAILSTQDPLPVSLNKWLNQFNPKNTYNEDFKNKIKQDPFFKSKL